MRLNTYKMISLAASRIRREILCDFFPGDRIPSEREIALRLNISHNRIHRALQQLIEDGVIYSTGGRGGMFYTSRKKTSFTTSSPVKLKFAMAIPENMLQYRSWKRACELYHMVNPSVEVEIVCDMNDEIDADLYLTWLPLVKTHRFRELDLSRIDVVKDMIPGCIDSGIRCGKQMALPLLHIPGVYWGHRNMLAKCGLDVAKFKDPMDYFLWGKRLEDSGLCSFGNSFLGFIYHACHWGVSCQRKKDLFLMDIEKVQLFFNDIKKIPRDYFHLANVQQGQHLFHRGQQGLFPGYLNRLPLTERKFQLLGQPLKKDGFSCQTMFLLAMGKTTKHENLVYDIFHFLLSDHIQELFIFPETKFSVIERIYRKQYRKVCDQTGVSIPPFDHRGLISLTDPDVYAFIGRLLYNETMECILGYKNQKTVIDSICRIDISKQRKIWLESSAECFLNLYGEAVRYSEKNSGDSIF